MGSSEISPRGRVRRRPPRYARDQFRNPWSTPDGRHGASAPVALSRIPGTVAYHEFCWWRRLRLVGAGYAVGYGLGHRIERLRRLLGDAERLVLIALALAAVAAWVRLVRRGRRCS